MNRDDIIRMAAQVEWEITGHDFPHSDEFIEWCERFAALAIAAEREACAKAADDRKHLYPEIDVDYHYNQACTHCAAAIRARGEK